MKLTFDKIEYRTDKKTVERARTIVGDVLDMIDRKYDTAQGLVSRQWVQMVKDGIADRYFSMGSTKMKWKGTEHIVLQKSYMNIAVEVLGELKSMVTEWVNRNRYKQTDSRGDGIDEVLRIFSWYAATHFQSWSKISGVEDVEEPTRFQDWCKKNNFKGIYMTDIESIYLTLSERYLKEKRINKLSEM